MDNLKPCPFCGEKETDTAGLCKTKSILAGSIIYYVSCYKCLARGPWSLYKKPITKMWNRRAVKEGTDE